MDECKKCKYKKLCKEMCDIGLLDVSCETVKEMYELGEKVVSR